MNIVAEHRNNAPCSRFTPSNKPVNLHYVLTIGQAGDYAAYVWDADAKKTTEWVASQGMKMSEAEARKIFHTELTNQIYRR